MPLSDKRESCCLLVKDNTEEGAVDLKSAIVVLNETEFPEFVHEKVNSGARCANHFRQHLLGNFGKHLFWLGFLAKPSEQQKSAGQPFLAGVKKLIYQVLLDSDVP